MHSEKAIGSSERNAGGATKLWLLLFIAAIMFVIAVTIPAVLFGQEIEKYEPVVRAVDAATLLMPDGELVALIGVAPPPDCYAALAQSQLDAIARDGLRLSRVRKEHGKTLAYAYVNWQEPQPSFRLYRNSVNLYMVANGYGRASGAHEFSGSYKKAEALARRQQWGMWRFCDRELPELLGRR